MRQRTIRILVLFTAAAAATNGAAGTAAATNGAAGTADAATNGAAGTAGTAADARLSAEISRWTKYAATNPATDEDWQQIKPIVQPPLAAAEKAMRDGRRYLALQKLAAVWPFLAASAYVGEHRGPESQDEALFEAEWKRMGDVLKADLRDPVPADFDRLRPAAVRALAEAAFPQVRIYYDASLEFGRSTMPDSGLFYIGSARAQREFVAFARGLSLPAIGREPGLRSLAPDIAELEAKLLAAYRPPASIDRHGEFIGASAALKEAQELDAAGLRYGALVRYLQAALRIAPLLPPRPPIERAELTQRLAGLEARLETRGEDHSIGRIFLESAQTDLAASADPAKAAGAPQARFANAEAIAADVLPRYFAALKPAPPLPSPPASAVTVTLVRWPYT